MPTSQPPVDAMPIEGAVRLRGAITRASDLAAAVERGQAQMPLRDHFDDLAGAIDAAPFTLTLVGLDAESRDATLGWLCDAEFHVLTLDVPGAAGLVELQLAERGYVLVKAGRRQEFDRLEPFLEAVRGADLIRNGDADAWLDPMHLEVTGPRRLRGLRLLIPESAAAVEKNPALSVRLRSQGMLLAVAGPTRGEPAPDAVAAFAALAETAPATWIIATGPSPAAEFFRDGWPSALRGSPITPVHIGPDEPPPFPEFLTDARSSLRRALVGGQLARRFESALEMLDDRIDQEVRQQTSRRKALTRRASALSEPGQDRPLREAADAIRSGTSEALSQLEARLAEAQRDRLLKSSRASNSIANFVEDLGPADLAQEPAGNVIRLATAPGTLKRAERLLRDILKADLRDDLARINAGLEAIERDVAGRPAPFGTGMPPIPVERLDEAAVWEAFGKTIHLDPRYRGELHQKAGLEGAFEWVMQGRRLVFLLTMMSSMGLSFIARIRERFAPVIVLLFAAGLYMAWRSIREEQRTRLDREVDRMREALDAEVRRLYEQVLRDWFAFATRYLGEVGRRVAREADDRLKSHVADLSCRSTRERAEGQEKLKVVETRLRELGGLAQQIARIRQDAADARSTCERATRDAVLDLQRASGARP